MGSPKTCLLPHTSSHTVHLLLSLVAPTFKSPRPKHPKFLLSKALSRLPAHSSFTIYFLGHHQSRPDFHHPSPTVFIPDPSEVGQLSPNAPSTRKPSHTTQLPPPHSPSLSVCLHQSPTSAKLSCLPSPIPFSIQLPPQTPAADERRGEGGDRGAFSSPLLASLFVWAPALTDPSLALSIALEAPTLAALWVRGAASASAHPWRSGRW